MTDNEVLAWIRLQRIPGVGPINGRKLLQYFGDVQNIFNQSVRDLVQLAGVGPVMAERMLNHNYQKEAENQYRRIRREGIRCLPLSDQAYPELLRECPDAPLILYQKGPLSFSGRCLLSIVGTRSMTDYGRRVCEQFIKALSPYDPVIISGLAYGIDIFAQRMALKWGLDTVSCLGHGLDTIYPRSHAKYVPEILHKGALLSEFGLGTPPEPMNFVKRNRIIAGLAPATVVIESGPKGGSLITADLAFGYDREVFAVPGRSTDRFSSGCNLLIGQQKAQLLCSPEQLVETLQWTAAPLNSENFIQRTWSQPQGRLTIEEARICEFLASNGIQLLDEIAVGCVLTVRETAAMLFQLEMKEIIRPHPGKRFELLL
ncbi:DNA-processing protein DprA [Robiginitalea sp.]|uniref:DNA-processing protein DprA n=1 Tax=Robiginitalea sp. TaxID=1902411 RepID=UPI003C70DFA4